MTATTSTAPVDGRRSTALRVFAVLALAEAISWGALLIAMFFKWVTHTTERGVQIVGPIHGTFFVLYCLSVLWCWRDRRWPVSEAVIGVLCSVPPFMTVWFERRVLRREAARS